MKVQETKFYAARADLETWLKAVEAEIRLQWIHGGLLESLEDLAEYTSFRQIPDFGVALSGQDILQEKYLIMPEDAILRLMKAPQPRSSRIFLSVAQQENRNSLLLKPGGVLRGTQKAVMAGSIENIWKTEASLGLFDLFRKEMLKTFTAAGSYRVGPAARLLAKQGYRLTENLRTPKERDLVIY